MKTIHAESLSEKDLLKAGLDKKFNGFVHLNEAHKNPNVTGSFNYYYPVLNGKLTTFTVQYDCDECGCSKIVQEKCLDIDHLPRSISRMKEIITMYGHSEGSSCVSYLKEQIMELKELVENHTHSLRKPETYSLAWDKDNS